jgi:hypothetical protein
MALRFLMARGGVVGQAHIEWRYKTIYASSSLQRFEGRETLMFSSQSLRVIVQILSRGGDVSVTQQQFRTVFGGTPPMYRFSDRNCSNRSAQAVWGEGACFCGALDELVTGNLK